MEWKGLKMNDFLPPISSYVLKLLVVEGKQASKVFFQNYFLVFDDFTNLQELHKSPNKAIHLLSTIFFKSVSILLERSNGHLFKSCIKP